MPSTSMALSNTKKKMFKGLFLKAPEIWRQIEYYLLKVSNLLTSLGVTATVLNVCGWFDS